MTLNSVFNRIAASVLAGMVLTLPFVAAEWVYSGGFPHGVPFAIFNVLFIEASVFAYLAISVFRTPRTAPVANWILPLIAKTAAMIILASSWVFIVADQMPCFLGGRGC